MKMIILAAALALSGCTSTQLAYTLGAGDSPQRVQELEAQRVQQRHEYDQAQARAEYYKSRCTRHHCVNDEELAPRRFNCSDRSLTARQQLACDMADAGIDQPFWSSAP